MCCEVSRSLQHLHDCDGLAEQRRHELPNQFDSPVTLRAEQKQERGDRQTEGKSNGTDCGSAVLLGHGSAKDRLHILLILSD